MNRTRFLTQALVLALVPVAYGQQFFYDAKRDKQAQDAAAAAKDVGSGSVFDKMKRNAERQTTLELKTDADWQTIIAASSFDDVSVWNDSGDRSPSDLTTVQGVSPCMLHSIFASLDTAKCRSLRCRMEWLRTKYSFGEAVQNDQVAIKARLDAIRDTANELKTQIEELKKSDAARANGFLKPLLDQLENGDSLLGYAAEINKLTGLGKEKSLGEIQTALTEIQKWATIVQAIWIGYQAIEQPPAQLLPLHEQLDLSLILIEQERLKRQGLIYARYHLDAAGVLEKLDLAQRLFCGVDPRTSKPRPMESCDVFRSTETIDATLAKETDPERLKNLLAGLYETAAAFSQGDLGVKLCSLREGAADRDAGILRASVTAKATEKATEEATQRLALYYKSGIKPSELAALLFSVAGGIAAPIAAAK